MPDKPRTLVYFSILASHLISVMTYDFSLCMTKCLAWPLFFDVKRMTNRWNGNLTVEPIQLLGVEGARRRSRGRAKTYIMIDVTVAKLLLEWVQSNKTRVSLVFLDRWAQQRHTQCDFATWCKIAWRMALWQHHHRPKLITRALTLVIFFIISFFL